LKFRHSRLPARRHRLSRRVPSRYRAAAAADDSIEDRPEAVGPGQDSDTQRG